MAGATKRQITGLVALVVIALNLRSLSQTYVSTAQQEAIVASTLRVTRGNLNAGQKTPFEQTMDRVVHGMVVVDLGLHGLEIPTDEKLRDYEQYLGSSIKLLEDQLARDAGSVSSESQLRYMEDILQSVGELKSEVQRFRAAQSPNFFESMFNFGS